MAAAPPPAPRGAATAPSPLGLSTRAGLALLPPRPSPRRSAGKKPPLLWGLRPRPLAELRPRHLASGRGAARPGSARHAPRAELAPSPGPGGEDRRESRTAAPANVLPAKTFIAQQSVRDAEVFILSLKTVLSPACC